MPGVHAADVIANSYMMMMSSGSLEADASQCLCDQWGVLDRNFSQLRQVTEKINGAYGDLRQTFLDKLSWSARIWRLFGMHKLLKKDSLGEFVCWEFKIEEILTRHALDILDIPINDGRQPQDQQLMVPGTDCTLSDAFTLLPSLWTGGRTCTAFLLLALRRKLFDIKPTSTQPCVRLSRLKTKDDLQAIQLLRRQPWGTLYLTILMCKLASFVDVCIIWVVFETVCITVELWTSTWSWPICWVWLLFVCWLTYVLDAYEAAMKPPIPMLTVRLHQRLLDSERLGLCDYTVRQSEPCKDCEVLPPRSCSATMPTCNLQNNRTEKRHGKARPLH